MLALKLAAFLQTVAAVRRHYLLLGRPHLDLQPGHLVVEPGPESGFLPGLWSFRMKLLGASRAPSAALGPDLRVALPPRDPRTPFASPAVRAARLASPATGELLIERVSAEKGGRWRVEGTLLDPHGFFPPPTPRDWILLAWPRDPFGPGRTATARLDPRSSPESVEMAITTEPLELDAALAQRLGRAGGFRVPGVRYKIYPALSAPDDLYSLGVLLLRILLVNDGQTLSALEPLIEAVPQGTGQAVRGARRTVEEALSAMLAPSRSASPRPTSSTARRTAAPGVRTQFRRRSGRACSSSPSAWWAAAPASASPERRAAPSASTRRTPSPTSTRSRPKPRTSCGASTGLFIAAMQREAQALIAELLAEDVGPDKPHRGPTDKITKIAGFPLQVEPTCTQAAKPKWADDPDLQYP